MQDSNPGTPAAQKLVALEAVRGIAAILVVAHHAMAGFTPRLHGLFDPPKPASLFGTPLFAFINGSAAVVVFFVLSGFVLTLRLIDAQPRAVLGAGLKRWPRLMLPVLAVNLASGLLVAFGLYFNLPAADAVQSRWLAQFFAWPSQGLLELFHAGAEGTIGTFFIGSFKYNSNLWTMYYELWGSFIVFLCTYFINFLSAKRYIYILLLVFGIVCFYLTHFMATFIAGIALSVFYTSSKSANWDKKILFIFPLIILLLGYHESLFTGKPEGFYSFLANPAEIIGPYRLRVLLHTIASVLLILLVLKVRAVKTALSGDFGALIGRLSFPIYLTHFLIIASVGSWVYLAIGPDSRLLAAGFAILATFVGTFLTALPVMVLDAWWLKQLNWWTSRRLPGPASPAAQAAS